MADNRSTDIPPYERLDAVSKAHMEPYEHRKLLREILAVLQAYRLDQLPLR